MLFLIENLWVANKIMGNKVFFSASRHFFKRNVTQSVAEIIFYSKKNTKLWSFSIKFVELIYNNINNTFMIKRDFA